MPRLELRLLGSPSVQVDQLPVRLTQRKALALLAYLTLEPSAHQRQKLADLFWPDSPTDVGRAALRNALSQLRQELGSCADRLVTERATVELRLTPEDLLDVQRLAQGHTDAWRGPFLEGLELEGHEAFDTWVTWQRSVLQAVGDRAFDQVTGMLLERAPEQAAHAARHWLTLDQLNEAAWRRLVRALLAAGQRAQAQEALRACREVLEAELGLPPAPETLALESAFSAPPPLPEPLPQPPTQAFVGRAEEFTRITAAFAQTRGGVPQGALISGEPGIGKTRLAQQVAGWVAAQGAHILTGRAVEADPAPLGLWADLLRRALRASGAAEPPNSLEPVWRAQLTRLLPELSKGSPALPAAEPNERLLIEALAQSGLALAAGRPLMLLLDDVQWADEASLRLLPLLIQRWQEEPLRLLVVLTVRAEALSPLSATSAHLTRLGRTLPLTRLALGPLSRSETQTLIAVLSGSSETGSVADWLYKHSAGQPLYLTEAFKDLLERQAIDDGPGGWRLRPEGLIEPLPGVRAVIEERLGRLPPAALATAQACAVLGEQVNFETVLGVADLTEDDALLGCETLLQTGLLTEQAGRGEVFYRLSHDRIRETLDGQLGTLRRRLLHRRAVQVLAGRADAATLADHAIGAGLQKEARQYLKLSAEDADRRGFARNAQMALRQALDLGAEGPERAELLLLLAEACERLGDAEGQREAGLQALTLARQLGASALMVEALNRLAWVASGHQAPDEWRQLSEEALTLARTLGDPLLLVSSLQGVSRSYRDTAPKRAYELQLEAMDLLEQVGNPKRLGHGHTNMAYTYQALGNQEQALEHTRLAVAAFKDAGHELLYGLTLGQLGRRLITAGKAKEAAAVLEEAVAIRERSRRRAPLLRAMWAYTLALTGEGAQGWTVLHAGLSALIEAPLWPQLLLWTASFLAQYGQELEAARSIGVMGALSPTAELDPDDQLQLDTVWALLHSRCSEDDVSAAVEQGGRASTDDVLRFLADFQQRP